MGSSPQPPQLCSSASPACPDGPQTKRMPEHTKRTPGRRPRQPTCSCTAPARWGSRTARRCTQRSSCGVDRKRRHGFNPTIQNSDVVKQGSSAGQGGKDGMRLQGSVRSQRSMRSMPQFRLKRWCTFAHATGAARQPAAHCRARSWLTVPWAGVPHNMRCWLTHPKPSRLRSWKSRERPATDLRRQFRKAWG